MTAPHDDCAALRLKCAALEAALRGCVEATELCERKHNEWDCDTGTHCTEALSSARAALSSEPTALREMLVEAFDAGFRERDRGERWDGYSDGNDYAAGILKGGGK